jgi:hypothetical protein
MNTFMLFCRVLVTLLLSATPLFAQNLIENGAFDGSTDGWVKSDSVEWSSFGMDYGSIRLYSESSTSSATQCVSAEGGQAFVVTAQVTGHCSGARLYAIWSAKDDCSDFRSFPSNYVVSKLSNVWEQLTLVVPARDDASKIFVELLNNGGCSGGYFFDDVTLSFDEIYRDDFEGLFGVEFAPH